MWNRIDPLIQPITRHVEESDPRMGIRKDESQNYGGRKKDSSENEAKPIEWEDTTIVSTLALANMLQGLLMGVEPLENESNQAQQPEIEHHEPANTRLSRATNAYQSTGRAVHDQNIEEIKPPAPTASKSTITTDFSDNDIIRIKIYIHDLQTLHDKGFMEIALQRTMTFLDAIEHGIDQIKNPL